MRKYGEIMDIKSVNSFTFEANRILTTRRVLKNKQAEVIDVFKLDKELDESFVRKCYYLLASKKKSELQSPQRRLKTFLKRFLTDKSNMYDYYLSINNGEMISGGVISFPFKKEIYVSDAFAIYPKDYVMNTLLYAFLNDSKTTYGEIIEGCLNLAERFNYKKDCIRKDEISGVKNSLKKAYLMKEFVEIKKKKNIDLEEFLDIKDINIDLLM